MAAQIQFDFTTIGEQIAAAVKEAVERATITTQPSFDIRAQIMANAQYLWPRARCSYLTNFPDSLDVCATADGTHSMSLIVKGGDKISGQIIMSQTQHDGDHVHEWVFLQGRTTDSPEKALDRLLRATMGMIEQEKAGGLKFINEVDGVYVAGYGQMDVPHGICEICCEAIWR
ncbi:hypothetical protein LTR17_006347 [Elasticomyces elasticus]|nr:hypothetical protein LTR17_006347 [Elasticomyces elasticus]